MFERLKTNPTLRHWARRTKLAALLQKLRGPNDEYEKHFADALLGAIRPGDVVWDIGANIGHYAALFVPLVGDRGRVLCFEPVAATYARLQQRITEAGWPNVSAQHLALGEDEATLQIFTGNDADGVTNSLAHQAPKAGKTSAETIRVARGDKLVEEGLPPPQVLKVDVEAYEEEVLLGLRSTLQAASCRAVFARSTLASCRRAAGRRLRAGSNAS